MPLIIPYVLGGTCIFGAVGTVVAYVADHIGAAAKNSEEAVKASQGVVKESANLVDKFTKLTLYSGGLYVVYKLLNK